MTKAKHIVNTLSMLGSLLAFASACEPKVPINNYCEFYQFEGCDPTVGPTSSCNEQLAACQTFCFSINPEDQGQCKLQCLIDYPCGGSACPGSIGC